MLRVNKHQSKETEILLILWSYILLTEWNRLYEQQQLLITTSQPKRCHLHTDMFIYIYMCVCVCVCVCVYIYIYDSPRTRGLLIVAMLHEDPKMWKIGISSIYLLTQDIE